MKEKGTLRIVIERSVVCGVCGEPLAVHKGQIMIMVEPCTNCTKGERYADRDKANVTNLS